MTLYTQKRNRKQIAADNFSRAGFESAKEGLNGIPLVLNSFVDKSSVMINHKVDAEAPSASPDHNVFMMCSVSYLGLVQNQHLIKAAKDAIDEFGTGYLGPWPFSGTTRHHDLLASRLARIYGLPHGIIVASATVANLTAIPLIVGPNDLIFSDEFNHSTLIDGCELSRARIIKYKHNCMEDLESQIKWSLVSDDHDTTSLVDLKARVRLIVTDGTFSMEGSICKLPEITTIAKRYGCKVLLDECHSLGCVGPMGQGVTSLFNLNGQVDIVTGTLGKSLGSTGGFVLMSEEFASRIRYAPGRIFSAGVPSHSAAVALRALELLLDEDPQLYLALQRNKRIWHNGLLEIGLDLGEHNTKPIQEGQEQYHSAIIPIMIRDNLLYMRIQKILYDAGIYTIGMMYPVIPRGQERLRTTVTASMTSEMLESALHKIKLIARNQFPTLTVKSKL